MFDVRDTGESPGSFLQSCFPSGWRAAHFSKIQYFNTFLAKRLGWIIFFLQKMLIAPLLLAFSESVLFETKPSSCV